jgi:membrane associated rhomboid family serine protease
MFVTVENRSRRRWPWTISAIALGALLAFLVLATMGDAERQAAVARYGAVPNELLGATGSLPVSAETLTLATALLVHADWPHLIGNLAFLLIFGLPAERMLGSRRVLALFMLGGVLANLGAALLARASEHPIVGMSGAVSALVGAYIALFPRARLGLVLPLGLFFEFVRIPALALIGFWILVQALFAWLAPEMGRVAWGAHLVGFATGITFAVASRGSIARRWRNAR